MDTFNSFIAISCPPLMFLNTHNTEDQELIFTYKSVQEKLISIQLTISLAISAEGFGRLTETIHIYNYREFLQPGTINIRKCFMKKLECFKKPIPSLS